MRIDDRERNVVRFTVLDPITKYFDPFAKVTLVMVMDVNDKIIEFFLGLPVI